MPTPMATPKPDAEILKFGGGVNSRASETDINPIECVDGENFSLDLLNAEFKNRQGIDLAGTAPNLGSIDGYAQLKTSAGVITTLIQAGTEVYSWDGDASFASVGTVPAGTKLRGKLTANSLIDEKVIIADLGLQSPVLEWDGTTLAAVVFTGSITGEVRAKYTFVENERTHYANIISNAVATPHLFLGSKRDVYTEISNTRPSSAQAEDDAFTLVTLDLRPVNAFLSAFGRIILSTEQGSVYQVIGQSAKDFSVAGLFTNSFASGEEAMDFAGNDVFFGRPGRIESLVSSDTFGDIEADDLSRWIAGEIETFSSWTMVFNSRTQRAHFFPAGQNTLYVMHKPILDATRRVRALSATQSSKGETSPWMKWTTNHPLDFKPTTAFSIFDPQDGLEKVFMGDSMGNIYRLEGDTADDDGFDVAAFRKSALYTTPLDAEQYEIEGYFTYRSLETATVNLAYEFSGDGASDTKLQKEIAGSSEGSFYGVPGSTGTPSYYGVPGSTGSPSYYGFGSRGRILRKTYQVAGRDKAIQIIIGVTSSVGFAIGENGWRFRAQQ